MYLAIKEVVPYEDFILHLKFENGEVRQFDMKPYLDFGIFKELKSTVLFNSVHVSFDTIEWDNEADLDPEFLYKNSHPI